MLTAMQRGVFLIQVAVVLAIVAILAGIAIPMMGSVMTRQSLDSAQETTIQTLQKAKWLARARGSTVNVSINAGEHIIAMKSMDGSVDERIVLPLHTTVSESIELRVLPTGEIPLPSNADGITIVLHAPTEGNSRADTSIQGAARGVRVSSLGVVAGM